MKISTTSLNKKGTIKLWSIIFWLLVWQGLSLYIGQEILLASPLSVLNQLVHLITGLSFWSSIFFSFQRIVFGFFLATLIGISFAAFAARFRFIEHLLAPLILFVNSTPVASIIILLIIWFSSQHLATIVSFLMVMPIIYTNILSGIKSTDVKLLEMAEVFEVPLGRRIIYIYISQVFPFFKAACLVGLGISWKAGVAAEVIGITSGSIGSNLHQARIHLATPDVFAWTFTIIIISALFERIFMFILTLAINRLERL